MKHVAVFLIGMQIASAANAVGSAAPGYLLQQNAWDDQRRHAREAREAAERAAVCYPLRTGLTVCTDNRICWPAEYGQLACRRSEEAGVEARKRYAEDGARR